jgi:hypothetical protein
MFHDMYVILAKFVPFRRFVESRMKFPLDRVTTFVGTSVDFRRIDVLFVEILPDVYGYFAVVDFAVRRVRYSSVFQVRYFDYESALIIKLFVDSHRKLLRRI